MADVQVEVAKIHVEVAKVEVEVAKDQVEVATTTKGPEQDDSDDLRLLPQQSTGWDGMGCSPRCKRGFCACCLLFVLVVSVLLGRFAVQFKHAVDYMHAQQEHTVQALSLNNHSLEWYTIDDVVMGGHSRSALEVTPSGSLRFYGNISTRDGGFSSLSSREQPLGLSPSTTGFNITISGNGELFSFSVKTSSSVWDPVWQHDLPPSSLRPGVRHSFVLPLASFRASRMGRQVDGIAPPSTDIELGESVGARVVGVGFALAQVDMHGEPNPHFRDGPFEMVLHSISPVAQHLAPGAPVAAAAHAAAPPSVGGGAEPAAMAAAPVAAPPSVSGGTEPAEVAAAPAAPVAAPSSVGGEAEPAAASVVVLASFDGGATTQQWSVMNDPVMGGRSTSSLHVSDGVASFAGTCAIVPFLSAPGFCKMEAQAHLADASAYADGGLHLTVSSSTPSYTGFKVGFSSEHMRAMPGYHHGSPAFKADFAFPAGYEAGDGFVTVKVPFSSFSLDTSEYTGRCDTTDPTGQSHTCCSAQHPEVCPAAEHLASLRGLQLWAEGVEGAFTLDVRTISAGA